MSGYLVPTKHNGVIEEKKAELHESNKQSKICCITEAGAKTHRKISRCHEWYF